jgi:hypothetical protein
MGTSPGVLGSPLTTENVSGGSNSLDQYIRSIEGITGQQGQSLVSSGTTALSPVLGLLTNLVKGDQGDVTQAAQPEIDQITQQFDQIRNMISLQPRGGGKTSALAEAPFQKSGDIQRTEGQLRSNATAQLGQIGTNLIGAGSGLESEGASIALGKQGLDYSQPSGLQQAEGLISTLTSAASALI